MIRQLFTAALMCGWIMVISIHAWDDYDINSIVAMNETTDLMDFKIKYKRINRTTYGMSGSVQFSNLMGIESELLIYHQPKGGNRFVLTPYKLPRGNICQSLNNDYRKFLMEDLHMFSNLPYSDDETEDLCQKFQNTLFEIKDFIMTNNTIPPNMEFGLYRVQGFIYKGDEVMNGIEMEINLY